MQSKPSERRAVAIAALAVIAVVSTVRPASARVDVGIGLGLPVAPPAVVAPVAPPPVVVAPPVPYGVPPVVVGAAPVYPPVRFGWGHPGYGHDWHHWRR